MDKKELQKLLSQPYTQDNWKNVMKFVFRNTQFNASPLEIKLETDYFSNRKYFNSLASTVVYTGCIDEFFDYEYGELEYRSLKFDHKTMDIENYQGRRLLRSNHPYGHTSNNLL